MRSLVLLGLGACGFTVSAATTGDAALDGAPDADPNADTDGDGVVDGTDNCPQVPNPAQHDFDGDDHGDECDRCPHLASGPDPDADGDGVGDDCDPRPAVAGDKREIWRGFYTPDEITDWRHSNGAGQWSVAGGRLVQSDPGPALTLLDSPDNYNDVYFAARLEIVTSLYNGLTEIGVCGGDIPQGLQYYCCALNGNNGKTIRATSAWNGSGGQIQGALAWPGTTNIGDTVDLVGTMTATNSVCTFRQGGVLATASTARGPLAKGSAVFYTQYTQARYHYIFVVSIGS